MFPHFWIPRKAVCHWLGIPKADGWHFSQLWPNPTPSVRLSSFQRQREFGTPLTERVVEQVMPSLLPVFARTVSRSLLMTGYLSRSRQRRDSQPPSGQKTERCGSPIARRAWRVRSRATDRVRSQMCGPSFISYQYRRCSSQVNGMRNTQPSHAGWRLSLPPRKSLLFPTHRTTRLSMRRS